MCTAITLKTKDFYFGRNLDLEYHFGEQVVVAPRNFPWRFRQLERKELMQALDKPAKTPSYAIIGMANITEGVPLFADAVNEQGLAMANLNFPKNAFYQESCEGMLNVAPFELMPLVLAHCKTAKEAKALLAKVNVLHLAFNDHLPVAPLHYIVADKDDCFVVEPVQEGLKIYDNPYGVLTNNPPFFFHLENVKHYLNLSPQNLELGMGGKLAAEAFGEGLGAFGLPGDSSPSSRFVKVLYHKLNSVCSNDEASSVSQFFHLLDAVAMTRGSVVTKAGHYDLTTYSSCLNTRTGTYYFKTYDNHQITAVKLNNCELDGDTLEVFQLPIEEAILELN